MTKWTDPKAITFSEYVFRLVHNQGKDCAEFKDLEKLYGVEFLRRAYAHGRRLVQDKLPKTDPKLAAAGDKNE